MPDDNLLPLTQFSMYTPFQSLCGVAAGEIVPQAICSHYGLAIGAWTAWFVRFLMIATGIISWPISKLLDWLLGAEHTVSISQLKMQWTLCPMSASLQVTWLPHVAANVQTYTCALAFDP